MTEKSRESMGFFELHAGSFDVSKRFFMLLRISPKIQKANPDSFGVVRKLDFVAIE
jgi:hypothetical protein